MIPEPITVRDIPTLNNVEMSRTPSRPPNVDPTELDKFTAMAAKWWDPNSELKPLHDINPLRLGYIEQLAKGLNAKQVLDVGCGGGILAEGMAARGANVTGIDLGKAPLTVAELHALESGITVNYRQIAVEALAQEAAASFDIVTCMEMLEHVPDPAAIVQACADLVKPNGWVFFATLNRNPRSYLFAIVGAEYILRLLPKGTHRYDRFVRPAELATWSRQANLLPQDITGMSYNPLSGIYCLGRDVAVNYFMACQKGDV